MHRVMLARLHALHAADAARAASLTRHSALVVVRAENRRLRAARNDGNHLLRAGLCADAAADANGGIHRGNPLDQGNCAVRTDLHAVAQTQTAVDTCAAAAEEQLCRLTRGDAAVVFLGRGMIAVAAAADEGSLCFHRLCLHAENRRKLFCRLCTAGDAEIGLRAGGKQRLRIAVAAGKAARAAVCTGQALADCRKALVFLDRHHVGSNRQTHAADQADHRNSQNGNQNFIHCISLLNRRTAGPERPRSRRTTARRSKPKPA